MLETSVLLVAMGGEIVMECAYGMAPHSSSMGAKAYYMQGQKVIGLPWGFKAEISVAK